MIFSDETKIIGLNHMIGHGVGLEIRNTLDLNMSINGNDVGMHDGFEARSMAQD